MVSIPVGGTMQSFEFKGGKTKPYKRKPRLVVDVKEEQDAIEKSKVFSVKRIKLVKEEKVKGPAVPKDDNKAKTPAPDLTPVPGIAKVQEAREYLLENLPEINPNEISNRDLVVAKAAENGIEFPDLK